MGGFKEQHTTIQALAYQTNDRLSKIYDDLQSALEEEEMHGYSYEGIPIKLFYQKLTKLRAFLDLGNGNLRSFRHSLLEEGSEVDHKDILKNKVKLIEDIYANELAFLFYLILTRPYHFGREDIAFKTFFPSYNKEPTIGLNIIKEKSEWAMSNLSRVFKTDKDVRSWFFARMHTIMDYQKRVHDSINEYYLINKHYQLIFRAP